MAAKWREPPSASRRGSRWLRHVGSPHLGGHAGHVGGSAGSSGAGLPWAPNRNRSRGCSARPNQERGGAAVEALMDVGAARDSHTVWRFRSRSPRLSRLSDSKSVRLLRAHAGSRGRGPAPSCTRESPTLLHQHRMDAGVFQFRFAGPATAYRLRPDQHADQVVGAGCKDAGSPCPSWSDAWRRRKSGWPSPELPIRSGSGFGGAPGPGAAGGLGRQPRRRRAGAARSGCVEGCGGVSRTGAARGRPGVGRRRDCRRAVKPVDGPPASGRARPRTRFGLQFGRRRGVPSTI